MATDNETILRAIRHACIAGSCEIWARRDTGAAAGLRKIARSHRRQCRDALAAVVAEVKG